MATLQNTIQGIRSDVNSFITNMTSQFKTILTSVTGNVEAAIGSIYGGDVTGINIDQIPAMQQAIKEYIARLDSHLAEVNANADTSNAYRGEFTTAIREYVESITYACGALTSQLLKFNDILDQVKQKYTEHAGAGGDLASQLSSQAAEIESSFTRYSE